MTDSALTSLLTNITRYAEQVDQGITDPGTFLVDTLTDLRLYADQLGQNFHQELDTSYLHYLAEKDTLRYC